MTRPAAFALALIPVAAHAGDKPLYAPAPDWVVASPSLDPAKLAADSPAMLVFDSQQRLQDGRVWTYLEAATRAASPEALSQLGTIAIPWMPDKGDLIVHSAEILRSGETIDLLKAGERFSVLRREQQLEQRMLSGMLTATMAAEGLRIGDVLRLRFSITQADPALKGGMQTVAPMLSEPFRAQFARSRLSWPVGTDVKWQAYADKVAIVPKDAGGFRSIEVAMPIAKQPDLPDDAPGRFRKLPVIEATSFDGWPAVSRAMAPLYATEGTIAPGSALAGEVAKITAAESDPLHRAAAALRLVQEQVRYLALGMNGGNYVPQSPARTWELRYGDCKAKTLVLLAMLRSMGVEGEAVLVSSQLGDLLIKRLPMPGAFDHVIVRADIAGKTYWLDGTGSGARLADIADTPDFRYVLPLRVAGSGLTPLPLHANARADASVSTVYDQTAGLDFPSLFTTEVRMRGPGAAMLSMATAQVGAKQQREIIHGIVQQRVGQAQIAESSFRYDPAGGIATITASGLLGTGWRREQKRMRFGLDQVVDMVNFDPDRARPAWRDIPVATGGPNGEEYRVTLRLPDAGKGFVLEGDQALQTTLAGTAITRRTTMASGVVTVEERADASGAEIAPDAIAAERAKVALAKTRELRVVAPADLPPRWQQVRSATKARRFDAIEAGFAKAIAQLIADDPEATSGYESRMSFRIGIYDYAGAIADATRMLAIRQTADLYVRRSSLHSTLGDSDKALADAREAMKLDPGSDAALVRVATIEGERGDASAALAKLQERIDIGGKDRFAFMSSKAEIQAEAGDAPGAIATLDAALAERPGDPSLLNSRCWIKGTRKLMLDTALKDCTKAIELADSPAAALDSRAMVYFRMDRPEEAMADVDAALDAAPGMSSSLFLRAVLRKRAGDAAGAETDLAGARMITPQIDKDYAKYGIAP